MTAAAIAQPASCQRANRRRTAPRGRTDEPHSHEQRPRHADRDAPTPSRKQARSNDQAHENPVQAECGEIHAKVGQPAGTVEWAQCRQQQPERDQRDAPPPRPPSYRPHEATLQCREVEEVDQQRANPRSPDHAINQRALDLKQRALRRRGRIGDRPNDPLPLHPLVRFVTLLKVSQLIGVRRIGPDYFAEQEPSEQAELKQDQQADEHPAGHVPKGSRGRRGAAREGGRTGIHRRSSAPVGSANSNSRSSAVPFTFRGTKDESNDTANSTLPLAGSVFGSR